MYFKELGVDSSILYLNSPSVPVKVSVLGRRGHKYRRRLLTIDLQWFRPFCVHWTAYGTVMPTLYASFFSYKGGRTTGRRIIPKEL